MSLPGWFCIAVSISLALGRANAQCELNSAKRTYPLTVYSTTKLPTVGPRKLFPIRKELYGDLGFINHTGAVLIPAGSYLTADLIGSEGLLRASIHEVGDVFLTEQGKIFEPMKHTAYGDFHEGLASFRTEVSTGEQRAGKPPVLWGYIDKTGAIKIGPLSVNFLHDFHEGLAVGSDQNSHYGYLDKSGRWKIPPQFPGAEDFSEGFGAVDLCDRCQYIDKDGNQAIAKDFRQCTAFHGGAALVEITKDHWAFINTKGDIVGTLLNEKEFSYYQAEGLMPSQRDYSGPLGFVNTQGEFVISPRFLQVEAFSEGLAAVTEDGLHWGYIDHSGRYVIPPSFHKPFQLEVGYFNEGLAFACNQANVCGFIDKSGKWVLTPRFQPCEADPGGYCGFNGGLAWVRTKEIEGYINLQGKFVWQQKAHPPDHTPPPPPPEPKH